MAVTPKTRVARSLTAAALILLSVAGIASGLFVRVLRPMTGEHTGAGPGGFLRSLRDVREVAISPKEGFPGQHRLTLLCMGIDDNWTDRDQVYTAQARTDTLFLLTLDLDTKKMSMLSIPRDTFCHLAGTDTHTKINAAYAMGGPQRALDTVNELLGVAADHYLVLNIDSTRKMVQAVGGVDLSMEHEMHYHDNWGTPEERVPVPSRAGARTFTSPVNNSCRTNGKVAGLHNPELISHITHCSTNARILLANC